MAAIHDLLAQIQDEALRDRIEQEVNRLTKTKKFGLVFEQHLPECTPLYGIPIKAGVKVMIEDSKADKSLYIVLGVEDEHVTCAKKDNPKEQITVDLKDVVRVAEFGEPIYPYLAPVDEVANAPDSKLWHTLIEADNYHALQLLEYLYAGKVDCIYIDPPYNTGSKDWKYNNDYVDGSDSYRHSKWLSMMEKRLRIAKKLLNPNDSVLIVTIDEKEYLHLGCLLEDIFSDASIQMVSSVINAGGSVRTGAFSRTDEYLFFVRLGNAHVLPLPLGTEWRGGKQKSTGPVLWRSMLRGGEASNRVDRPNMFYPVLVKEGTNDVVGVGDSLKISEDKNSYVAPDGCIPVWPIKKDGSEGRWRIGVESARSNVEKGYIKANTLKGRITISYLAAGVVDTIENGGITTSGKGTELEFNVIEEHRIIPGTAWQIPSHDASKNGTAMLKGILKDRSFPFPKSVYAVYDAIRFFVDDKPHALIVDFFAGSGTTLHAVNLLNAVDGGERRCIIVTNNEVSESETKELRKKGLQPGDDQWEQYGIARYITWPRTVCSIKGQDITGKPLSGNYSINDMPMTDGFKTNAAFFKLGFLDKTAVALGFQFKEMLPTLWMKAGAYGKCPSLSDDGLPEMLILEENKFAVLIDENCFAEFERAIRDTSGIETVYLVTDYEVNYRSMSRSLGGVKTFQLYRDYLDNFRINQGRN